ncbi:MAG: MotA/TolQ/ExbB proton channel family protein [Puniceicoccales bacterium]|jgi:biopolymer transport protein ExbB|nr:MotA/TolQ/ExbB proton channel family protein [Puniceicoccales bacterium]
MKTNKLTRTLRILTSTLSIAGVATCAGILPVVHAQQAATPAPAAEKAPAEEKKEMTLLDRYNEGGWVMHFLLLSSVLTIWFGIDGVLKTTRKRAIPPPQVAQLREFFRQGDYVGAYNYAKGNYSPFCDVVRTGISFLPDGKVMTEEAMFGEIARVNGTLMGRVSYLSVIGVCSPMIGLTGTVLGMMKAFDTLGSSGVGDPSKLSSAIGHVLVATASGLFVAIPAFILYYVLRNRITVILHDIQEAAAGLFRKMPYESFTDYQLGDDEIYAAPPNWIATEDAGHQG